MKLILIGNLPSLELNQGRNMRMLSIINIGKFVQHFALFDFAIKCNGFALVSAMETGVFTNPWSSLNI